jgi:hypothetical protein
MHQAALAVEVKTNHGLFIRCMRIASGCVHVRYPLSFFMLYLPNRRCQRLDLQAFFRATRDLLGKHSLQGIVGHRLDSASDVRAS